MPEELRAATVDLYGPLTYKKAFRHDDTALLAATWVPQEHRRRLRAYTVFASYVQNVSREMLDGEKARLNRREYGDAKLIVETIVAAILGEETTIRVDDAGAETGEGESAKPVNADADALQEWFESWDDDEHVMLAVEEAESDAVGLGDGILEVTWDGTKKRPRVTVYEPGFYFPVLETLDQSNDVFPPKLHIAWEFERWQVDKHGNEVPVKYVRKITWELRELPDGQTKSHPWNDEPTTLNCYKSDATWKFEDLGSRTVNLFSDSGAVFAKLPDGREIRDLDLDIDYIPVLHEPNTIARKEHFGLSSLAFILQILDDIQATDTDLALASRTTGTPPLWSKGPLATADSRKQDPRDAEIKKVTTYGPGQLFDGEMGIVDTSKSLDALLGYIQFLLRRLSSNAQLPEAALGRVDPSKIDAGVIMALSFGPLARMVKKMRLVRQEKHPLLLKMVARTALKYSKLSGLTLENPSKMPKVRLMYGRFMPLDRTAVIEMVTKLFAAKLISRLQAVQTLMEEAGLSIEDANEEVVRIEHEDFEGAGLLADASDDINEARKYLGLEELPPDQVRPQPPDLNLPTPPGAPPQPPEPAQNASGNGAG